MLAYLSIGSNLGDRLGHLADVVGRGAPGESPDHRGVKRLAGLQAVGGERPFLVGAALTIPAAIIAVNAGRALKRGQAAAPVSQP